jgi:hypothetical protein
MMRNGNRLNPEATMQAANQNLKHPYAAVSATGATFIAEQRDTLDAGEMRRARAADAAEPATHVAYRQILKVHGYVRAQLNEIRRARHAQGKPLSVRGLAIVDQFTKSGWIVSRPRFDVYEAEQIQLVASNRAHLKQCWNTLRRAEDAEFNAAYVDAVLAFAAE